MSEHQFVLHSRRPHTEAEHAAINNAMNAIAHVAALEVLTSSDSADQRSATSVMRSMWSSIARALAPTLQSAPSELVIAALFFEQYFRCAGDWERMRRDLLDLESSINGIERESMARIVETMRDVLVQKIRESHAA